MDAKTRLIPWIFRTLGAMLIFGLAACAPEGISDPAPRWTAAQVRALDPAESTPNPFPQIDPTQDLIAVYSRETATTLQIRLDFLDLELTPVSGLPLNPAADITLQLNFTAGDPTQTWNTTILIPAEGHPRANLETPPLIQFDSTLDCIIITLARAALPDLRPGYHLRIQVSEPGSGRLLDEIPAVSSETHIEPLPVLLAFWNTLPAHTPAQALRRWDGAHTGPLGERHGLKHLLTASESYQIPITLLDLKTPTSLAALDLLGQSAYVAALQRAGLLILPETLPQDYFGALPIWTSQEALQTSRDIAVNFGLKGSEFVYESQVASDKPQAISYEDGDVSGSTSYLLTMRNHTTNDSFRGWLLPTNTAIQTNSQGLTLETRRALLKLALAPRASDEIATLGGDLTHSTWGDPQAALAGIRDLAGHSWLQVVNTNTLQTLPIPPEAPKTFPTPAIPLVQTALTALQKAPPSSGRTLAWQMFMDLSAPAAPASPELAALRAVYLGEIGNLLAATKWETMGASTAETQPNNNAISPIRKEITVDCQVDTDFDEQAECVLANADYFALLDPDGGRLTLLIARFPQGAVQLVGSSAQLVVGLSDYREWNLSAGVQADPAVILGAFAGPWEAYQIETLEDGVRLSATGVTKTYRLSENGLRVEIETDRPMNWEIPLLVAPESRFFPGWADQYGGTEIPQGWAWGISEGPRAEIKTSGGLSNYNFQDSSEALSFPEDPNLGYPAGHFLPFPLAIVTLPEQTTVWVEISRFEDPPPDR